MPEFNREHLVHTLGLIAWPPVVRYNISVTLDVRQHRDGQLLNQLSVTKTYTLANSDPSTLTATGQAVLSLDALMALIRAARATGTLLHEHVGDDVPDEHANNRTIAARYTDDVRYPASVEDWTINLIAGGYSVGGFDIFPDR